MFKFKLLVAYTWYKRNCTYFFCSMRHSGGFEPQNPNPDPYPKVLELLHPEPEPNIMCKDKNNNKNLIWCQSLIRVRVNPHWFDSLDLHVLKPIQIHHTALLSSPISVSGCAKRLCCRAHTVSRANHMRACRPGCWTAEGSCAGSIPPWTPPSRPPSDSPSSSASSLSYMVPQVIRCLVFWGFVESGLIL